MALAPLLNAATRLMVAHVPSLQRTVVNTSDPDTVELDVEFQWLSEMDIALSLSLWSGSELLAGVSDFQIAGTVRMQMFELVPVSDPHSSAFASSSSTSASLSIPKSAPFPPQHQPPSPITPL